MYRGPYVNDRGSNNPPPKKKTDKEKTWIKTYLYLPPASRSPPPPPPTLNRKTKGYFEEKFVLIKNKKLFKSIAFCAGLDLQTFAGITLMNNG